MTTYVRTTAVLFTLIVLAHIWRIVAESRDLIRDPFYLLITACAAGLSIWAWMLVRRAGQS